MQYKLNFNVVKEYIDERKISDIQFCVNSKISLSDLNKLKNDDHSITFEVLEKISHKLNISIINLICFDFHNSTKFTIIK